LQDKILCILFLLDSPHEGVNKQQKGYYANDLSHGVILAKKGRESIEPARNTNNE
jgi:hypothetical protein